MVYTEQRGEAENAYMVEVEKYMYSMWSPPFLPILDTLVGTWTNVACPFF